MIIFNSPPVNPIRITSQYGKRNTGIAGATTDHQGVDLGANKSLTQTPILAVADGTVVQNYWNNVRGYVIYIRHNGFDTLSQHLKVQSPLKVGTIVKAGQTIGIMGNSSSSLSIAVHLHFEVRLGGLPTNPEPFLLNIGKEVAVTYEDFLIFMKRYRSELAAAKAPAWAADELEEYKKEGITDGSRPMDLEIRLEGMLMAGRASKK